MIKKITMMLVSIIVISCSNKGKEELKSHILTVNVSPQEGGSVNPSSGQYLDGTFVELKATPSIGYIFKEWTGVRSENRNPLTLLMDSDKIITAIFKKQSFLLTVEIDGEGIVNEEFFKDENSTESIVKLSAIPSAGWEFKEWGEDLTGTENPTQLILNRNKKVISFFKKIEKEFNGPVIESYTFTPNSIDITNNDVVVTVKAHVTDKSGVKSAPIVYIQHPGNSTGTQQTGFLVLKSGTNKDGIYSVDITIPKGLQPGEWNVFSNSFVDVHNNSSVWPVYPTSEKKTLTVISN